MSSDDFGTVNARRGERAREIEVMRQHYRQHRDALQRMSADAPTEHLATEYQRLIVEIDRSLVKLEELEGRTAPPPTAPPAHEPAKPHGDPLAAQRRSTHPAMRGMDHELAEPPAIPPAEGMDEERSRLPLIIGAALVALAVIAGLIWWASNDRGTGAVVEEPVAVATATDTVEPGTDVADDTISPAGAPIPTEITVAPSSHDFGVIRKGTRATRQYEISNTTDEPVSIVVARSACRCLYYEHAPVISPKAKENLTVTVDGARAKAGELREQIRISSKADAAVSTTIDVNATIR
jgi:Protein of unknown function (DUF1573)